MGRLAGNGHRIPATVSRAHPAERTWLSSSNRPRGRRIPGACECRSTGRPWIAQADAIVFLGGDMDAAGHEILDRLPTQIPHTRSVLMDTNAYERYERYGTNADAHGTPLKIGTAPGAVDESTEPGPVPPAIS